MAARATSFRRAEAPDENPFEIVVLDADARHLRRKLITLHNGGEVLVDFAKSVQLEHGDRLVLEDGREVGIVAAPEELMEVKARDADHLTKLAWHIGNRHLPAQIETGRILLRRDAVIAKMQECLGATVTEITEPFSPEHGAYHSHGH